MKKITTLLFVFIAILNMNNSAFSQANSVGLNGSFVYNSIAAAYAAIGVVGSPQLVELSSAYTGANEVAPVSLTFKAGVSALNTITIRPSAGANGLTLSKASANSIFRFDSCSYVILDGRPGGITSSTADYLNVSNTTASGTSNAAIMVGATYCIIRYVNATGVSSASGCRVINISGSPTSPSTNNLISNNVVRGGLRGIQDFGFTAPTFINSNNIISNNDVADFNNLGILVAANSGCLVTQNRVHSVSPVAVSTTSFAAIQIQTSTNITISKNTIDSISTSNAAATPFFLLVDFGTGSIIKNNKITNVVGTAFISQISGSQLSGTSTIYSDNEISNISLSRASSFNVGIAVSGLSSVTTINVLNNKILNLSSSTTTNVRAISTFVPAAGAGSTINLKNNFISITAPNNSVTAIFGILTGNTTGVGYISNIYNNSIRIGGNSIGGTAGSVSSYGILKSDNNAGSTFRSFNNNILNERTANVAFQVASFVGNITGTLALDSNNYYATDTVLGYAGGWVDTIYKNAGLASYKAYAAPNEVHTTFGNVNKLAMTMNYQACPGMNNVTVELRSSTSPYNIIDTDYGIAGANTESYFNFNNAVSGVPYYIVVKNVNMLP